MALWARFRNTLWEVFDTAMWPGMDRRLLTLSRDHLGYRSTKFPLLVLFVPHCVMILGLLLSGPILGVMWLAGRALPDDPLPLVLIGTPFSVPFLIFLPVILGHRSTRLDRRRGEVRELRGLALPCLPIVPLIIRRRPLADFHEVALRLVQRKAGKGSTVGVYEVALVGRGAARLPVVDTLRLLSGRRLGERVAAFAQLPLRDETAGEHVVRAPDALDRPLAEHPGTDAAPPLPAGSELRLPAAGSTPWRVELPAAPFAHWGLAGFCALFLALAAAAFLFRPEVPPEPPTPAFAEQPSPSWEPPSLWPRRGALLTDWVVVVAGLLSAVTAVVLLLVVLARLATWPRGYVLTALAGGLEVRRRGPLGTRRSRFPRDELEEIRLESKGGQWRLLAISDRRLLAVTPWLAEAEAHALRHALIAAVRASDRPPESTGSRT